MSQSLLTDLYQLTMAYGYWKTGMQDREAVFHLFFRRHPFQGGYTLSAGLAPVIQFLEAFGFSEDDLAYLASLTGNDGEALFDPEFLTYLGGLRFEGEVYAMPEGTVVFPQEPMLRIQGPVILCQLLETPLLNLLNFQTLIATKAARICRAAAGAPVLEFGLRRAQGVDGALAASRAAYIGGCAATSNVLAGKQFGIPVKGTHAHSWIMAFPREEEAFEAYANALPNNCIFLVDTYNSLRGVKRAIETGRKLREKGHEMIGIRLDSGDLADISYQARKLLDEAGFPEATIVASDDLDEYRIAELKARGAKIDLWGVGTRLVTAYDQPALGGVFKLAALRAPGQDWQYTMKISEKAIKSSQPGILQVRRFRNENGWQGDMIIHEEQSESNPVFHSLTGPTIDTSQLEGADLLVPIFQDGRLVYDSPTLPEIQQYAQTQLADFDDKYLRQDDPAQYPVGLEQGLARLKKALRDDLLHSQE